MKSYNINGITTTYSKPTTDLKIGDTITYSFNQSGIELKMVGMTEKAYKCEPLMDGQKDSSLLNTVWIPKSVVYLETTKYPNIKRDFYVTKDTFCTQVFKR